MNLLITFYLFFQHSNQVAIVRDWHDYLKHSATNKSNSNVQCSGAQDESQGCVANDDIQHCCTCGFNILASYAKSKSPCGYQVSYDWSGSKTRSRLLQRRNFGKKNRKRHNCFFLSKLIYIISKYGHLLPISSISLGLLIIISRILILNWPCWSWPLVIPTSWAPLWLAVYWLWIGYLSMV